MYQEVFNAMQVTSIPYGKYDYQKTPMNKKVPGSQGGEESFGNAVTKAEKGKQLNLALVAGKGGMDYGLIAMLSESSTPDNPIIQIISGVGGIVLYHKVLFLEGSGTLKRDFMIISILEESSHDDI